MSEHHAVPLRHAWVLPLTPTAVVLLIAAALIPVTATGSDERPWLIVLPWLIFGLGAAYWQLRLCEGARSRPLHAAIGFSYTFVFTAVTLLLAVVSARVVD